MSIPFSSVSFPRSSLCKGSGSLVKAIGEAIGFGNNPIVLRRTRKTQILVPLLGQISISPYANQLPGRGRTKIRSREGSTRKMGSSSELQFLQAKSRAERNFGGGNFLFQTKRITPRVTSRFRRLAPQVDKYYRHKSQGKLSLLYKV
jgi:hypothetical protein